MVKLREDLLVFPALDQKDSLLVQDKSTMEVYKFSGKESLLLLRMLDPKQREELTSWREKADPRAIDSSARNEFAERLASLGLIQYLPETSTPEPRLDVPSTLPNRQHYKNVGRVEVTGHDTEEGIVPSKVSVSAKKKDWSLNDRYWHLFRPEGVLDALLHWFGLLRYTIYGLPPALLLTIIGLASNWDFVKGDLAIVSIETNKLQHLLLSLFTTSLLGHSLKGLVARAYHWPVPSFGIKLLLGIMPRFSIRVSIPEDATKQQRLRLASAGLIARLFLLCIGFLLWIVLRGQGNGLSLFGLLLTVVSMISLFLVANPLLGGAGYQLLSIYFDNPGLRRKALLLVRHRKSELPRSLSTYIGRSRGVWAYAFGSVLFSFAFIGFITYLLATWLELNYGGLGVVIAVALTTYVFLNLRRRLFLDQQKTSSMTAPSTNRTDPAGRRRDNGKPRNTPAGQVSLPTKAQPVKRNGRPKQQRLWPKIVLWILFGLTLLLPYRYEPGGPAVILPRIAQEIYAEYPGVVERVYFESGEPVGQSSVLAEMSNLRESRDVEAKRLEFEEQQYRLRLLETTPTEADVALAEAALKTAQVKLKYNEQHADRIKRVYEEKGISLSTYEEALRDLDVSRQEAVEKAAALEALRQRINPFELEAARAKLKSLSTELSYFEEVLERTKLRMPFNGRVITLHLKNLQGKYLADGDLFARVEDTAMVIAEIAIPESDMSFVSIGAPVRIRLQLMPNKILTGQVAQIAPTTEAATYGQIVKVFSFLDNPDLAIKSGMTGHAKVGGEEMIVAEAFTRSLVRFFQIEFWSWLP
ncbi:MAG: efflux RND transporter periplasmic adaptor subunit [Chromatiaceae bacterium]|nr:efflux RND transporter periplasmic adaptor subunit [Chromatiaceae bacterium]